MRSRYKDPRWADALKSAVTLQKIAKGRFGKRCLAREIMAMWDEIATWGYWHDAVLVYAFEYGKPAHEELPTPIIQVPIQ